MDDKNLPGPKIGITLPGKVLEASEHGVVDGAHVQWTFPLARVPRPQDVDPEGPLRGTAPARGNDDLAGGHVHHGPQGRLTLARAAAPAAPRES